MVLSEVYVGSSFLMIRSIIPNTKRKL